MKRIKIFTVTDQGSSSPDQNLEALANEFLEKRNVDIISVKYHASYVKPPLHTGGVSYYKYTLILIYSDDQKEDITEKHQEGCGCHYCVSKGAKEDKKVIGRAEVV